MCAYTYVVSNHIIKINNGNLQGGKPEPREANAPSVSLERNPDNQWPTVKISPIQFVIQSQFLHLCVWDMCNK